MSARSDASSWTFFTNHTHLLMALASHPDEPLRKSAERVGITERAAHLILQDLIQSGVLQRWRQGRQNRYEIHLAVPLRHPLEAHATLTEVLSPLLKKTENSNPLPHHVSREEAR